MSNKRKVGRKSVMTKFTIGKLEEAFSLGCNDHEAALFAGINPDTLYEYQKKHPEFSERKLMLKQNIVLKARLTLFNNISDPNVAKWVLERKRKEEFNPKYIKPEIPEEQIFTPEHQKKIEELLKAIGEEKDIVDC